MKILLMGLHKPTSLNETDCLFHFHNGCNFFCSISENLTLISNLNVKSENENLNDLCKMNKFDH